MEFFIFANIRPDVGELQDAISMEQIEQFCESIVVLEKKGDTNRIGTVWGEFELSRQVINGGLRFTLVDCPNALAWTITTGYPPEKDKILIHLTINRTEKSEGFVESIIEFGEEWKTGMEDFFN